MPAAPHIPQVLFYLGYDNDCGGICSFIRTLSTAAAPHFTITLGVNPGFTQHHSPQLATHTFVSIDGEKISLRTIFRARTVARSVQTWLHAASASQPRIFHGCSRAGLLVALWLARWGERRVVATVHCYGRHRWFYRHAARTLGSRLHFLSPEMSRYYGLPAQTWDECLSPCIHFSNTKAANIVDRDAHTSLPAQSEFSIRAAGIGAFSRMKRWELVLQALAQLPPATRTRWHFTHIGSTDGTADSERYGRKLHALTRTLGLEAHVRWLGQQPTSAPLLREADILLVPSDHEAFSLARLEALNAGVPSLSSDTGAALDLITPATNGWLFRNNDAVDLARMLEKLSAPGALAEARIDRESLERFSAEASVEQHARLYESVLSPS